MRKKPEYPKGMRFYPTFVMEDVFLIFIYIAVFCALIFFAPEWIIAADENIPADPFNTPEHIKPEWYFLAAYQSLKLIPSEIGALVIQHIVVLLFVFLPMIDRSKETNIKKRPAFLALVLVSIGLMLFLTYWGAVS